MIEAKGSEKSYTFKPETFNGITIIRETNTGYVNVSKMCADNGKKWRQYRQCKQWKEIEKNACKHVQMSGESARLNLGGPLNGLSFDVINCGNEFRGTYLHPKLVHFVAEYVSIEYAFKVSELMDSINTAVHEELEQKQLPDTPENAKPVFDRKVSEIFQRGMESENQQCWGYRDHNKFDYLDTWDKSYISGMFDKFKTSLKTINVTLEEIKRDYPHLLD